VLLLVRNRNPIGGNPLPLTRERTAQVDRFSARKKHFVRKRQYALAFTQAGHTTVAQQLIDCQETEVLACCSDCGQSWYILNRCRLRVCPLCSWEVSKKRADQLAGLAGLMKYPKMITLTMPLWEHDPKEGIKYLRECWNSLRRSKVFARVRGGAYQIELKPKDTGWHIHMHAIVDAPYLPHQQIYSAWTKILGVNHAQIDIRAAKSKEQQAYVAKYASKAADFHSGYDVVVKWYEATKGQRLFATFGKWFNQKMEELGENGVFDKPKPVCPYCKSESTTFLARDGPFIFGGRNWNEMGTYFTRCQDTARMITEVRSRCDEEFKKANRYQLTKERQPGAPL